MMALVSECTVADLNKFKVLALDLLEFVHVDINLRCMGVFEIILRKKREQNWVFFLDEFLHVSQTIVPE